MGSIEGVVDVDSRDVTYGTDYLSELHDLTLSRGAPPSFLKEEGEAFLDCLKQQSPSPGHGLVVLDIGTGGGRVAIKLAADAQAAAVAGHEHNTYIGVDISEAMIRRAHAATRTLPNRQQFVWEIGDARKLTSISALSAGGPMDKVDLAMFPISSMCHLVRPQDQKQFLSELSAVLRPGTGRGVIALHDHFVWNRSATKQPAGPVFVGPDAKKATFDPNYKETIPSEEYKDTFYRRLNWGSHETPDHQVITSEYDVQVWQTPGGQEEVMVEEQHVKTVLRPLDETTWLSWVREAGLALDQTKSTDNMTMYVLKHSQSD